MTRSSAATLAIVTLALAGALAARHIGSRPNSLDVPSRAPAAPALVSLRQRDVPAFLARHAFAQQGAPAVQHDTVTHTYAPANRLLHTRLRLMLTVVGDDRVIRAELGFAPFLLDGADGASTRALLSDLFGTFMPRTDAARVADLRAEIERHASVPTDSTTASGATGAPRGLAHSDAYLALRARRDSSALRYPASHVWIDNSYFTWRRGIDSPNAWVDSATIVQIALPGDSLSHTLHREWDQRPEALGGTLAVLGKALGREEIATADAIRMGNSLRYPVWRNGTDFVLLVELGANELAQQFTFQQMKQPGRGHRSTAALTVPFLELARTLVPEADLEPVWALQYTAVAGGLRRADTPTSRRVADALAGTRGPVVLNLGVSSVRFDQATGGLPRMTIAERGRLGAATDSAPRWDGARK